VENFGLVEQLFGHLLARGPKPGSIRAGWTLHDEAIKEEFGQFLFGECSGHGSLPTLKRSAHHRVSVRSIILQTHILRPTTAAGRQCREMVLNRPIPLRRDAGRNLGETGRLSTQDDQDKSDNPVGGVLCRFELK